ncbi:MAG: polysaccharide deacetylase family protein [Pseudomonadota bacterium]|nr:polysaccharide deacetylase family protein [Pseudomonadota bacterium]
MVKRAFAALLCLVNGLLIPVNLWAENAGNSANHGVILQYHHIATGTPPSTSLAPEVFRRHLEILKQGGFSVLPLPKLVVALQENRPLPDRAVVITFDDAYDDIAQQAAPMLEQFGFPYTIFVSTDFVDRKQSGYMTWDQLRGLQGKGANLANHTRSHLHLLRKPDALSQKQWLQELREEIDGAEQRIQAETGEHWRYLAYPYGEADETVIKAVTSWGYLGFGQQSGAVNKTLLNSGMAPRYPFNQSYQDLDDFRIKASSLPLPLKQETFPGWVFDKPVQPELILALSTQRELKGQLNCYASGQGAIALRMQADNVVVVQVNKPIPVGRSRYNCTLPVVGQPGRYHWHSRMWIRKREDGSWYPEP